GARAPGGMRRVRAPGGAAGGPGGGGGGPAGRAPPVRAPRHARRLSGQHLSKGPRMSTLRAKCPDCQTFTAVAMGPDYQCHSCGREFAAGLVRVPRAWGNGGEDMAEAARLPLGYPEALVVEEDTLDEQNLSLAAGIPARPLILGGCCCSHIGTVEGLAARHGRIAVV